jgi:glycine/D-amino acid oxidase-like deaminating enzyme
MQGEVLRADVVIVGAGITGAFLAERMTGLGKRVVLIDRREPQTGSTAASTAMLLWELDAPLLELEDRLGFAAAKAIAWESHQAVAGIGALVAARGIRCGFRPRHSIYLSGDRLDAAGLREEHRLRRAMDLPGELADAGGLLKLGLVGEAGLVSPGSAEADPMALARGLLDAARARGAVVLSPAVAVGYDRTAHGVEVTTAEGALVKANALLLANGYEMPDFVPATAHTVNTSWALSAHAPAGAGVDALVWEASDPYLYLRGGPGGRVIVGGEDEEVRDPARREAMTGEKVAKILECLKRRRPALRDLKVEHAWSGLFGETQDALPMIGPVPGYGGVFAAFGYGGNGITFSAIAAGQLEAAARGQRSGTGEYYAIDRSA